MLPEPRSLRVVPLATRAERLEIVRIAVVAVRTNGYPLGVPRLDVSAVLSHHHERATGGLVALDLRLTLEAEGRAEGNGVSGPTVEVAMAVNLHDARHGGHRSGCAHVDHVLGKVVRRQVGRGTEDDVRRHREEGHGVCIEGLEIAGVQVVLDVLVEELPSGEVTCLCERRERHEPAVVTEREHDAHGASDLPAAEARGVDGSRRDAPNAREPIDAVFHEHVEDTCREHAAKAAALEDERRSDAILHVTYLLSNVQRGLLYPFGRERRASARELACGGRR